jgi:hypothetical protein
MLVIFQYINFKYLTLFSNNYLDGKDDKKASSSLTAVVDDETITAAKLSKIVDSI